MARALELARRGIGGVHPNPLVGALLVRRNKIIAEGAHEWFGGPHAEINALSKFRTVPPDATLYCTLEPCTHTGKTPPCVRRIIEAGVKKVVIACLDANPLIHGRGIRALQKAGVRVIAGVRRAEAEALNKDFSHWVRRRTPYVVAKVAQSLDGKTQPPRGAPRWITGLPARRFGHELRAHADAILVGINTVLKDDPLLSVRHAKTRKNPVKIVLDSRLRTPVNAKIFSQKSPAPVWIAVTRAAPRRKWEKFRGKADLLLVPEKKGRVDIRSLLRLLGQRGIARLLVEGGAEVLGSFFKEKAVQEVYFFVAPQIIGGSGAACDAFRVRGLCTKWIGRDLLIHGSL
ncbi:MAG: bifunctional diaminohydroxyphosphoribosylaminopyrimidine deaminase/5-amino-6-(5-phosphoribosylamino)uracil reductase RibD [Candidatus Omnitrophica bacterium]|nr:bifunctional diaminohydroxyphosphoribosylaminopyrimidine deaminase/5-amino-6-(5-phosphoribosylamino)uracil reductase RibD [Candidatus Omnitrophota bacterium]